jgi:hypothetical protein
VGRGDEGYGKYDATSESSMLVRGRGGVQEHSAGLPPCRYDCARKGDLVPISTRGGTLPGAAAQDPSIAGEENGLKIISLDQVLTEDPPHLPLGEYGDGRIVPSA